ncbi:MAG: type II toxin-antitoxin system PemK/MazF family toxin [Coriobacteriales bacterium]|nr:type II toxin-antitoxin system PemK/MazF family toxin [Coriobacteriales bacterium]
MLTQRAGANQKRRPAVVISTDTFNNVLSSLTVMCPITTSNNGHPLHIETAEDNDTEGFICIEQLRATRTSPHTPGNCAIRNSNSMTPRSGNILLCMNGGGSHHRGCGHYRGHYDVRRKAWLKKRKALYHGGSFLWGLV